MIYRLLVLLGILLLVVLNQHLYAVQPLPCQPGKFQIVFDHSPRVMGEPLIVTGTIAEIDRVAGAANTPCRLTNLDGAPFFRLLLNGNLIDSPLITPVGPDHTIFASALYIPETGQAPFALAASIPASSFASGDYSVTVQVPALAVAQTAVIRFIDGEEPVEKWRDLAKHIVQDGNVGAVQEYEKALAMVDSLQAVEFKLDVLRHHRGLSTVLPLLVKIADADLTNKLIDLQRGWTGSDQLLMQRTIRRIATESPHPAARKLAEAAVRSMYR